MPDWKTYKGAEPWKLLLVGSWVADTKGQGVWPFMPQEDKWGYLNNPRWLGLEGKGFREYGPDLVVVNPVSSAPVVLTVPSVPTVSVSTEVS